MKNFVLVVVFVLVSGLVSAMDNDDVRGMLKKGKSESEILLRVKTERVDFEFSIKHIKKLRDRGASDILIKAMIDRVQEQNEEDTRLAAIAEANQRKVVIVKTEPEVMVVKEEPKVVVKEEPKVVVVKEEPKVVVVKEEPKVVVVREEPKVVVVQRYEPEVLVLERRPSPIFSFSFSRYEGPPRYYHHHSYHGGHRR